MKKTLLLGFRLIATTNKLSKSYDRAAKFYEKSAHFFSFGRIRASKFHGVEQMKPGDKAIFLGVGSGEEAIHAAQKGVEVTCVDISQKMLDGLEKKLASKGLSAELLCQDALQLDRVAQYDFCAANYFLNVFREPQMIKFMEHGASLVKPGGKFLIADVARSQGNFFYQAFNICYLKWAMFNSWLIGLVPFHKNYDYPIYFPQAELALESVEFFRLFPVGPVVYQCIIARKLG
jgi:ubiquinone/menaquinone biosynthesis C-methylase UbiE